MSQLPPLFAQINNYSKQHTLIPDGARVIIGLSGGPDSVFLTYFLASLKNTQPLDLIAAHLNHEWRPESAQDVQFCAGLCAQLNIPFISSTISELNLRITNNGSKEAFARKARRLFFERIINEYHAHIVALAHHAQDQQETFFIRLIRGAGITGLSAMHPRAGIYIRPLLETNKHDIVNYLTKYNISYLTDPTNVSLDFLRNRVRHLVIPALHATDQRFDHNFQRTLHNLHSTEQFLTDLTETLFNNITVRTESKIMLNSSLFLQQHEFMQHRILMHFLITEQVPFTPTHYFIQEITRFISQSSSKHYTSPPTKPDFISRIRKTHRIHPTWQLVKSGEFVFIEKHSAR